MVSLINKNTKNKLIKLQKNRFFKKKNNINLVFADSAILTTSENRLELVQIRFFKKIIKFFFKKKELTRFLKREKIWYFFKFNFFLQKKSKNSRMGKGKGLIERKVLRFNSLFKLFEISGISIYKLKKLILKINKKLNFNLFFIFKKSVNVNNWFFKNSYFYFYNKYLY